MVVRYGCVWGVGDALPIVGLVRDPFGSLVGQLGVEIIPGEIQMSQYPPRVMYWTPEGLVHRDPDPAAVTIDAFNKIVQAAWKKSPPMDPTEAGPVRWTHVDCMPVDANTLLLFLLWKRELRAWRGEWVDMTDPEKARVKWAQEPVLRITTFFDEPFNFYLYGTSACLFLVTETGQLYVSRASENGERKFEVVWNDPERPIRVMISDAESGKDYAFAPAPSDRPEEGQCVYFELAEKVKPVRYDLSRLKPVKVVKPLRTVLPYARLLFGELLPQGK